jgi:kinase-associated protein B
MNDRRYFHPGDQVVAEYKSGAYIGELLSSEGHWAKVRMLAVLKHPAQGDLHHPMRADVPMFHERRALAFREVANVPVGALTPWDEATVPDYMESLRDALERELQAMESLGNAFGDKSAAALRQLEKDYFK